MALKHLLFSQNSETVIEWFEKFDRGAIKASILKHLSHNPTDVLEHCKEFSKSDLKKYAGYDILDFYKLNSKGEVCKIITRGNKEYLLKIKI
jgi:hypothetical protein